MNFRQFKGVYLLSIAVNNNQIKYTTHRNQIKEKGYRYFSF